MATIAENVLDLAMLVKDIKRKTQLSETTIMRVVDMTFALAQQNQNPMFGPSDDEDLGEIPEDNVIEFPMADPTPEDEA
jgi:hypothetical protein